MNRLRLRRLLRVELARALSRHTPGGCGTAREAPAAASSGAAPRSPARKRPTARRVSGSPPPVFSPEIDAAIERGEIALVPVEDWPKHPCGACGAQQGEPHAADCTPDPVPWDDDATVVMMPPPSASMADCDQRFPAMGGGMAEKAPVTLSARPTRPLIDLSKAPSSMETRAAEWKAKP